MPYGWHNEATILSYHHWMKYNAFLDIMDKFRFKSFTVKANRDIMRTTLENLASQVPFSVETRFPKDHIYIDLHHSVVSGLLRQLSLCLDISDRQVEKDRIDKSDSAFTARTQSNMEDAKVAFYSVMHNIIDLIGTLTIEQAHIVGVYTQGSFEEVHRLIFK